MSGQPVGPYVLGAGAGDRRSCVVVATRTLFGLAVCVLLALAPSLLFARDASANVSPKLVPQYSALMKAVEKKYHTAQKYNDKSIISMKKRALYCKELLPDVYSDPYAATQLQAEKDAASRFVSEDVPLAQENIDSGQFLVKEFAKAVRPWLEEPGDVPTLRDGTDDWGRALAKQSSALNWVRKMALAIADGKFDDALGVPFASSNDALDKAKDFYNAGKEELNSLK